jgi:hypothetical protein
MKLMVTPGVPYVSALAPLAEQEIDFSDPPDYESLGTGQTGIEILPFKPVPQTNHMAIHLPGLLVIRG